MTYAAGGRGGGGGGGSDSCLTASDRSHSVVVYILRHSDLLTIVQAVDGQVIVSV